MTIPKDIAAYAGVTAILEPFISEILAGKHVEATGGFDYNPAKPCPDFERTLAEKLAEPISVALHKNLYRIANEVCVDATKAISKMMGERWERSGGFWYPAANGFMDWHTNHTTPGARIYLVWCREGGKSRFIYSPDCGKTMIGPHEPAGWSVNVFMLREENAPLWHAITSGGTDRISFGFKRMENVSQRVLMQGGALFQN